MGISGRLGTQVSQVDTKVRTPLSSWTAWGYPAPRPSPSPQANPILVLSGRWVPVPKAAEPEAGWARSHHLFL